MQPESRNLEIGIRIHALIWKPSLEIEETKTPFILIHGLSSNARTWEIVGNHLAEAGHPAAAIDLRGHGLSDKPESDYGFQSVTHDLKLIKNELGWEKPIMAGQSWGGNVLLEYAANYPGSAAGYVFVDGGFLNLRERGPWEETRVELRPPDLIGTPRSSVANMIRKSNPGWSEEGIEATLGNFETFPDQTVRPWLTLERHMEILRSMYDQDPPGLFSRVDEPVLICAADDGGDRMDFKQAQVQIAVDGLKDVELIWFNECKHDIHVDKPDQLAGTLLDFEKKLTRID